MGRSMKYFVIGLINIFLFIGLTYFCLQTDNQKPRLLDAFILVNLHDGLSDWGLEQMDLLLDCAME